MNMIKSSFRRVIDSASTADRLGVPALNAHLRLKDLPRIRYANLPTNSRYGRRSDEWGYDADYVAEFASRVKNGTESADLAALLNCRKRTVVARMNRVQLDTLTMFGRKRYLDPAEAADFAHWWRHESLKRDSQPYSGIIQRMADKRAQRQLTRWIAHAALSRWLRGSTKPTTIRDLHANLPPDVALTKFDLLRLIRVAFPELREDKIYLAVL